MRRMRMRFGTLWPDDPGSRSSLILASVENQGLLFIPDISGFTRFVSGLEIEHSRFIIQQLLEVLMDANELDLEISEVEGDAILFYKFGESPDVKSLYAQVERMFCDFHRHLMTFDMRRLCQCKACGSAVELSLKVITHYGEFTGYNVRSFSKLIGKDVIVAHQLLKNDIPEHEYWLVTSGLLSDGTSASLTDGMEWGASSKTTETGEIPFHYTQLGRLKSGLRPKPMPQLEPEGKVLMQSVAREYESHPRALFYILGHMELTPRWQEGVKHVEEVDHFLSGMGARQRVIMHDNTAVVMSPSSFSFEPERIVDMGLTDESGTRTVHCVLEKLGEDRSRLTIQVYLKPDQDLITDYEQHAKAMEEGWWQRSLENLDGLVKEMGHLELESCAPVGFQ
jgi:hypothetical protein